MPKEVSGTLRGTKERITITVADNDVNEHGFLARYVTDLNSGVTYIVTPKSCGVRRCKCENWFHPTRKGKRV